MPGEFNNNERGKGNGKPSEEHRGNSSSKQGTQKLSGKRADNQTLVMPIRIYYIASGKEQEGLQIGNPVRCQVWSVDDIHKICNVTQSILKRLFNIKTEYETMTSVDVSSFSDLHFQEGSDYRKLHSQFNKIIQFFSKDGFNSSQTHVLFVGRIYKGTQKEASAMGLTLNLTTEQRDFNLGGNKIVISYVYQRQQMPKERFKNACSITAGYLPAWDLLGIVLAHELGHSLHLAHIEDEPIGLTGPGDVSKNIMKKDLEEGSGTIRSYKWFPPNDYRILPFQVNLARQFGLCTKRFKDTNDSSSKQCNTMLHELGIKIK